MTKEPKVMVLFTQSCSPYMAGERAGFKKKDAARLVASKTAIYESDEVKNAADEPNDEDGQDAVTETKGKGKAKKGGKKPKAKRKRVNLDE